MQVPKKSTFSIVAYDPESELIAVGGTSHWFAYYRLVPFIQAGLGAVATQAECNLEYPEKAFTFLKEGKTPAEVVKLITEEDNGRDIRQVLVIDKAGKVAAYTGNKCVRFAEQYIGENFAIAGNMLANSEIITGMAKFYENSRDLPFTERLLKTLQEGQRLGGDFRGKRSAGLLVAPTSTTGKFWQDIKYDLRVDDHINPLDELERLYAITNAYKFMEEGDHAAFELKDKDAAVKAYEEAYRLFPENPEIRFWYAKLLNDVGMTEKSKEVLDKLVAEDARWKEYWERVYEV
jgi:uncharacterized Ntn-hydrolase superfamily protein